MGYYTAIELEVQIQSEKFPAFQKKMKALQTQKPEWWSYYSDLMVEENDLSFVDNYRTWYHEEKFYQFLAPYVEKDSWIVGHGEEAGDAWKIVFDGEGRYKTQYPKFVDADMDRLVNAAPELLKACEALLAYQSIHPLDFENVNTEAMDRVRNTVAKARGK